MNVLFPDARGRSATAVSDKADALHDFIYSAAIFAHGSQGQGKVFTVPIGQAVPVIGTTATTAAHQTNYSESTTNLSQAGQLGAGLGDASVNGIGITIEQAGYTATAGALGAYGAGPTELPEILSKTFFKLKVAGKDQQSGPTWSFPGLGGAFGSIASTGNNVTVGIGTNGWPGTKRRVDIPILVARTDTLEGTVGVASTATLTFSVTTGAKQSTLAWYALDCYLQRDVR